jgi:putative chitinase
MLPNSLTDSIKSKVLDSASDKLGVKKITPAGAILNVIAKNFLLFPSIARDVNVARQNMQILVKMAGGKSTNRADSTKEEDDRKQKKIQAKSKKSPTPEAQDSDGLGSKIGRKIWSKIKSSKVFRKLKIGFKKLKRSIVNVIKKMFNKKLLAKVFSPKNLLKVLFNIVKVAGPIGLIVSIVSAIGVGFYDAWNEYQKSSDLFESLKAGLGGILDFLSFGLFGKEEIDKLFKWIPELWEDFSKAFFDFKEAAIKFVSDKFTMILDFFGPNQKLLPDTKEVSTDKSSSNVDLEKSLNEAKNNIQTLQFIKSQLESELNTLQKDNDRLDEQIATLTAQVSALSSKKTSVSPEPVAPSAPAAAAPVPVAKKETVKAPAPIVTPEKKTTTDKKPTPPGFEAGKNVMIAALDAEGIKDPNARAQIIAQAAHESGKFRYTEELGKSDYFLKYDGRKDLGNTQPGDGPRFKGRGFLQTTGRVNYQQFKDAFNVDVINNPEILGEAKYAAQSALFWFKKNAKKVQNLSKGDWADTKGITKAVNGGYNGLAEREHYFEIFKNDPEITGLGKTIEAKPSPSSSGEQVAQVSSEVSKGQREQLKPTGVNVINMEKTNNKTVAINQTKVTDKHQGKAADTLVARAA